MSLNFPIYLDYNATTPLAAEVLEAMMPYLTSQFGNASSRTHLFGWKALEAVDLARIEIASLIGGSEKEIVFTSGATEANNLAIKGVYESYKSKGNHFITLQTEHKAILDTFKHIESWGAKVTYLKPSSDGLITLDQIEDAIRPETIMASFMYANNETGVVLPIKKIGDLCREKDILFHTDATQAVGKIPIDVSNENIDLMSFSGHKFYGPKGIGCLYVNRKEPAVKLTPLLDGGNHERGFRSGTLNVPGIVGMAKALGLVLNDLSDENSRLLNLRNSFENKILSSIVGATLNGHVHHRLNHVSNISFGELNSEFLIPNLVKIAVSSGSACTSASLEPSHVLKAMNVSDESLYSSIRFSMGRYTTSDEIEYSTNYIIDIVNKLKSW
ncbi:IscS subfamily cysteine desulfurase [Spirosoma sp. BT702]|uniref:cysteine desulfurase n=1 Tax=Spirosoma profusum TaxID=2771354 RepID=A0A926XZJ5_9BACT|nr:IscS subfamily cysteine desulfurase [Spirosoma profusum]MBD2703210.1 IscS subfamily cysteine desulfurase [Spirosoma profusum]